MRLLIINFAMDKNSPVWAWQASVADALAKNCQSVLVLTEQIGDYDAPPNVIVELLKHRAYGIPYQLGGCVVTQWRLYKRLRSERIDACFIHMNHRWSYRLYPLLGMLDIPILLWFAHGTTPFSLRLALFSARRVITSSPEGFRIPSPKVRIIGQGIDTDLFRPNNETPDPDSIVTISRISRRKRIDLIIRAIRILKDIAPHHNFHLTVIGAPLISDDRLYAQELKDLRRAEGLDRNVAFSGFIPHRKLPSLYQTAFLHVNLSATGSMDKSVLEALSCGSMILTTNISFRRMLEKNPEFFIPSDKPEDIAERILQLRMRTTVYDKNELRALIVGRHDLTSYVQKIFRELSEIAHYGKNTPHH